jgi:hypothetical protein
LHGTGRLITRNVNYSTRCLSHLFVKHERALMQVTGFSKCCEALEHVLIWGRYNSSNRNLCYMNKMDCSTQAAIIVPDEYIIWDDSTKKIVYPVRCCIQNFVLLVTSELQCCGMTSLILIATIADTDSYNVGRKKVEWIWTFLFYNSVPVWCHDPFRAKNWTQTYTTTDRPYIKVILCLPQC